MSDPARALTIHSTVLSLAISISQHAYSYLQRTMRCTFQTRQSARKTECVQEVSSLMLVPNTRTKYQDSSHLPAKEPVKKIHMTLSLKHFRLSSPTRDLFVYDDVDPYNERDMN